MHDPTSRSWRASAIKDGKPVFLYTVTTDAMVQMDLGLPKLASLIESARQIIPSTRTDEQNHLDLAAGAFIEHVKRDEYASTRTLEVQPAESLPTTEPIASVGGSGGSVLCSIWEEEKWSAIKETALRLLKETAGDQIRLSQNVLRDRWDLSEEEIRKISEYAASDPEMACDRDGEDLVLHSRS
jgi:hypothetical protein